MDVSVILVNFNGRDLLGPCLESIPRSTRRAWEAILVDNGSSDESAAWVEREFPTTRVIRNPENRGFAVAVNQGMEQARGSHLLLLNPDARLADGALDLLLDFVGARGECGIAVPQLVYEDGRKQHSFDGEPTLATALLNKAVLRRLFPDRYPSKLQDRSVPTEVESGLGAAFLIRGEAARGVGKFDEDYFLFFEETDYCLRARRAGWKIFLVPKARVVHHQGRSKARVRMRAKVEYLRSLFTFFRKHRRSSYPWLRCLYPFKNAVEVLGFAVLNALTLFLSPRARLRLAISSGQLLWQLLLCPRSLGLSGHD